MTTPTKLFDPSAGPIPIREAGYLTLLAAARVSGSTSDILRNLDAGADILEDARLLSDAVRDLLWAANELLAHTTLDSEAVNDIRTIQRVTDMLVAEQGT